MKTLKEIATYYGTAKVPHGYMEIYERYFNEWRNKKISLLEIGVATGASMRTWIEYFKKGHIVGVDKELQFESDKCELIEGDITHNNTLANISGEYHIIIDDGSHRANEQLEAVTGLWDMVMPGGYYVIEDLFTLYDQVWNPDQPRTIIDCIHDSMKNIITGGDSIQEVHYYGRNDINGILFLRKRYEEFRIQPLSEFNMNEIL